MSRRLLTAGIAAALAFGPAAHAAVVITALSSPLEIRDEFFGRYDPIDLDGNGIVDYTFVSTFSGTGFQTPDLNRAVIRLDPPPNIGGPPVSLGIGYIIGATLTPSEFNNLFWDDSDMSIVQVLSTGSASEFNGRGAIGLEFRADDGIHYGYFDISAGPGYAGITLYGWAYESQPGISISVAHVPEPSALTLAGVTTACLLSRRRRK
ncbi:hypothetical protein HZ994_00805 [Akkermansiaceae bacterium]|nr:hypothetical protein HZ994_00805 [Akkermansiaceae bacterium]